MRALFRSRRALPRWAIASLVANIGIVLTGGIVRLTGSGLGCPTWPRCTAESFVPHPALGIHGAIEFGNRLLTFVLILIAVGTLLAAIASRRQRPLALAMALGIPVQGVIGGISVLTGLNPYVVSLHLVASLGLIGAGVVLVRRSWPIPPRPAGTLARWLSRGCLALLIGVVLLGTLVTGSGPYAGDAEAPRNGLDPAQLSTVHAGFAYAAVAATVLAVVLLRSPAAVLLLAVEVLQAGIGVAQYRLGLPITLVALHLLGAALTVAAATNLAFSVTRSGSTPGSPSARKVLTAAR